MSVAAAGYLARRAAQKERVRILYRRALKDTLNWAVHRHLFYEDADLLRARFENNKHVEDPDTIDRMIADGEAQYNKWRHPDPYIVPWSPGGSKFTRNPTPPEGTSIGQEVDTCVWFSPTSLGWELMSLFRMESAPHDLPILLSTSSLNLEKIISAADPDRSTADSFFLKSQ